jgi:hypothetical protein
MKTATIPSVRVEPEIREQIEHVLAENESLSQFVEAAVLASVRYRAARAEFIARGLQSLEGAKDSGEYFDASEVIDRLQKKLNHARAANKRAAASPGGAARGRRTRAR